MTRTDRVLATSYRQRLRSRRFIYLAEVLVTILAVRRSAPLPIRSLPLSSVREPHTVPAVLLFFQCVCVCIDTDTLKKIDGRFLSLRLYKQARRQVPSLPSVGYAFPPLLQATFTFYRSSLGDLLVVEAASGPYFQRNCYPSSVILLFVMGTICSSLGCLLV